MKELGTFGELVKLKAFVAFASAEEALANINDISAGTLPPSPRTCPRAAARCQPTRLHTALHAAAAVGEGLPPGRRRRQGTTLSVVSERSTPHPRRGERDAEEFPGDKPGEI